MFSFSSMQQFSSDNFWCSRLNWNDGSGGRARLMFPKLSTTHPMCGNSVSDS